MQSLEPTGQLRLLNCSKMILSYQAGKRKAPTKPELSVWRIRPKEGSENFITDSRGSKDERSPISIASAAKPIRREGTLDGTSVIVDYGFLKPQPSPSPRRQFQKGPIQAA